MISILRKKGSGIKPGTVQRAATTIVGYKVLHAGPSSATSGPLEGSAKAVDLAADDKRWRHVPLRVVQAVSLQGVCRWSAGRRLLARLPGSAHHERRT